jgi:DUF4097 and DUF4098 domain-containing protein YvlB
VLAVSGCYNCARSLRKAMAECKVEKSVRADFTPGSKLVVRDCDGAVNIWGSSGTDCSVTATAFVHAPTKREAREIAEQLEIAAEPDDGGLVITVRKPPMPQEHRFVSVDLDIVVPRSAHVDCETTFGRVRLAGIAGDVKASTQLGSITCEDIHGSLDLETQLGRITCREIVAERIVASSQKGSIDISCADACPAEIAADVSTEWGKIRFDAPPGYQGALELDSEMGSVKLDKAVDVRGTIEKSLMHGKVSGRVGSGNGNLHLSSNLGSVALR